KCGYCRPTKLAQDQKYLWFQGHHAQSVYSYNCLLYPTKCRCNPIKYEFSIIPLGSSLIQGILSLVVAVDRLTAITFPVRYIKFGRGYNMVISASKSVTYIRSKNWSTYMHPKFKSILYSEFAPSLKQSIAVPVNGFSSSRLF
ncbi:unnamed protein product, partial [Strongylus vulgaris]